MKRRVAWLMGMTVAAWCSGQAMLADTLIGSPDMPATVVESQGDLREDWGLLGVRIDEPIGWAVSGQEAKIVPVPEVITSGRAGSIQVMSSVYRSPIAPSGVDVLTVSLTHSGGQDTKIRLRLQAPESVIPGLDIATCSGRAVLTLPAENRTLGPERAWGCKGGVVPMPGWASPKSPCDPAFKNISAGMGGVPIVYRFGVEPGARRTVILGLCESFHQATGQRPLILNVEGAPKTEVDPLVLWGQHGPGCIRFDAADANSDGRLEVTVAPHPQALDRNPILNVIWVFKPDQQVNTEDVLAGKMSSVAETYVDVGGSNDQPLYEKGPIVYEIPMGPGSKQTLTFLVASPGSSVPAPDRMLWTPDSLRKAAEDVWQNAFRSQSGSALPEPLQGLALKLVAQVLMTRIQTDDFYLALPGLSGPEGFSFAQASNIIAALDLAGFHREAERLLRVYWDLPAPEPLVFLSQGKDGTWQDKISDSEDSAWALMALVRHGLWTKDTEWTGRAWPSIKAGAEALRPSSPQDKKIAATALMGAARLASLMGVQDASSLSSLAQSIDPGAQWMWLSAPNGTGPVSEAAQSFLDPRLKLAADRGEGL